MDEYYKITEQYLNALQSSKDEREIHAFLKSRPYLVRNAFNAWAWNHVEVFPEYQLNNEYRIDFLILSADSGQWHVSIVELKSPFLKPFTKGGLYSKYLNEGIKQLEERIKWLHLNQNRFRQQLSKHFRKNNSIAHCSNADDHIYASTEILDPRTCISFQYFIVIGRRNMISHELQSRRHLAASEKIEIATYDRMIDIAEGLDKTESGKYL